MIAFAFKIAAATGSQWSEMISRVTGSPYSHVELWLDGPINNARCFSSREPHGAGFEQIDLSDARLWNVITLNCTPIQETSANGFCLRTDGKIYDGLGLVPFVFKKGPELHDYHAVFCSEVCAAVASKCANKDLGGLFPWQVSPGMLYDMAVRDFMLST